MNDNVIKSEFGEDCRCENDVVKNCMLKTKELMNALKVLGINTSKSSNLNYIYTYFLLKLQDTKKENKN